MRDLTENELKAATSWATHYQAIEGGYLIWESKDKYQTPIMSGPKKQKSKLTKCKPIPTIKTEPFDITKHELFKSGILTKHKNGKDLHVNHLMWRLDKNRAIAIAKSLGVTVEDLK